MLKFLFPIANFDNNYYMATLSKFNSLIHPWDNLIYLALFLQLCFVLMGEKFPYL